MPYAEPDDVRRALERAGSQSDVGSAAGLPTKQLEDDIANAAAQIDARLRGRYTVPFDDDPAAPRLIKDVTVAIAAYRATLTFRQGEILDERHPVWLAYQDALDLLAGLADGSIILDPEESDPSPGTDPGGIAVVNRYCGDLFQPSDFDLGYSRGGRCG